MRFIKIINGFIAISLLILLTACSEKEQVQQEQQFPLLDGEVIKLSDYQGKWVLINYWAIWCKPCREEIPELNRFAQNHADEVVILGVNFDGVVGEELIQQVDLMGIKFPVLMDDPKNNVGVSSSGVLPETLVIDKAGVYKTTLIGPQTEADLARVLNPPD